MATVEIQISRPLQHILDCPENIQAKGDTIEGVIHDFEKRQPKIKHRLIDNKGKQASGLIFILNGEDIRSLDGLHTPVNEGDVLSILIGLAGG